MDMKVDMCCPAAQLHSVQPNSGVETLSKVRRASAPTDSLCISAGSLLEFAYYYIPATNNQTVIIYLGLLPTIAEQTPPMGQLLLSFVQLQSADTPI